MLIIAQDSIKSQLIESEMVSKLLNYYFDIFMLFFEYLQKYRVFSANITVDLISSFQKLQIIQ